MATMNISLPDQLRAFIDDQVAEHGYGTSSEYIRMLVRKEQALAKVRALVMEGGAAPIVGVADEAYFESKREYVRQRAAARKAG